MRSKNFQSFTSFASILSVIGLAIGVAALIITTGILNGFEKTISKKLVTFDGNIQIQHILGNSIEVKQDSLFIFLNSVSKELRIIPFIRDPVLIRKGQKIQSILLEGISEENIKLKLETIINAGSANLEKNQCIIGRKLADELKVSIGDKIIISHMDGFLSNSKKIDMKQLTISGLFQSGVGEYDKSMMYATLTTVQDFFRMNDQISGISIYVPENFEIKKLSEQLFEKLGYPYFITTWKEKHSTLYEWMSVQKWPILIIFSMIALVGIINIVSAISMIILEKIKEIGLLKSLGCSLKKIRFIFLLDGVIIGTMGTSLGGIIGLGLIWIQKKYQLISIPSDVYFMDRIPVMISWKYFFIIIFLSIIVSIISSIIPTAYTEKIKPSEAISYE